MPETIQEGKSGLCTENTRLTETTHLKAKVENTTPVAAETGGTYVEGFSETLTPLAWQALYGKRELSSSSTNSALLTQLETSKPWWMEPTLSKPRT